MADLPPPHLKHYPNSFAQGSPANREVAQAREGESGVGDAGEQGAAAVVMSSSGDRGSDDDGNTTREVWGGEACVRLLVVFCYMHCTGRVQT